MRPVKILTRFNENFAKLWEPMWFENPEEKRKTNAYRLAGEYCKRSHHPPQVYLMLPKGMTPADMIDKLVNLVATEEINARGTNKVMKLRVFPATIATTPRYETHVIGWGRYGKAEPGHKVIAPELDNPRQLDSNGRLFVQGRFDVVHLNLRTYSSTGRAWSDLHVVFKKPEVPVTVHDYWHGMNKLVHDNSYQIKGEAA